MNYKSGILKKPSSKNSEDVLGFNNNFYWIIDGATPPHGEKNSILTYNYVNLLNAYLSLFSLNSKSPKELLSKCLNKVIETYDNDLGFEDTDYLPYSTIIITMISKNKIDYLVLGDSYLQIYNDFESIEIVDDRLKKIAVKERSTVQRLRAEGVNEDTIEYKNARKALINEEGKFKNRKDGYWVLGFDEEAVSQAIIGEFDIKENTTIFAFTDGLARLKTHLISHAEFKNIAKDIILYGDEFIFNRLRTLESNPDMFKKPISSKHDDASYFLLKI